MQRRTFLVGALVICVLLLCGYAVAVQAGVQPPDPAPQVGALTPAGVKDAPRAPAATPQPATAPAAQLERSSDFSAGAAEGRLPHDARGMSEPASAPPGLALAGVGPASTGGPDDFGYQS